MANQFMDSASNCALTRSFPVKITSERLGRLIQFVLTASMQWSGGKALKTQYCPLRIARLRSLAAIFLMLKNRKISVGR